MKKIISLMLVALLTATLITGCGGKGDSESEQVTLKWYIAWSEQKDKDKVQDVVNEMLSRLIPNTTLEIIPTNLAEKWSTYMASNEPIDIAYVGYQFNMSNDVAADSYMALDELIEKYAPNIRAEREKFVDGYESGVYKDKLYAIPNMQPIMHQTSFLTVPADLYEYFPTEEFLKEAHSNQKTTRKMYDLITQYFETVYGNNFGGSSRISATVDMTQLFSVLPCRGYDWVYSRKSGAYLCYDAFDDNSEIVSFIETDAYKLFCEYAAKWYDAGYIPKDIMVSTTSSGSSKQAVLTANSNEILFNMDEDYIKYQYDADKNVISYRLLLETYDQMFNGTSVFGSNATYTVIPYTCTHPERAIKLIDLIHSEEGKDLYNTICYGIEGEHYTLEGDDLAIGNGYTVQADSYDDYGIPHWVMGNVYNAYRTPNIVNGQKEYCLDFIENVKPTLHTTPLHKFHGDLSKQANNISQITAVLSEYMDTLMFGVKGSSGWTKTYDLMVSKVKGVGLNTVVEEINKQADEYKK